MDFGIIGVPLECKFEGAGLGAGEFTGYAAVFGNQDSHGDVIDPKAFDDTLAQHKAEGRRVPMHLMHSVYGGDGCPVGIWKSIAPDEKGLRVHGKISGMNTDAGKLTYERLKDGAYGGLSIGYNVAPDGAVKGKEPGDPKRVLKSVRLHEISLVDSPSNALARIDEMKARQRLIEIEAKAITSTPQADRAAAAIAKALALHKDCMSGGDSPTAEERDQFLAHMQDAHEALTGKPMPEGMKSLPDTIRGRETAFREMGFSRSQASKLAEYAATIGPRDEAAQKASEEARAAADRAKKRLAFLD